MFLFLIETVLEFNISNAPNMSHTQIKSIVGKCIVFYLTVSTYSSNWVDIGKTIKI